MWPSSLAHPNAKQQDRFSMRFTGEQLESRRLLAVDAAGILASDTVQLADLNVGAGTLAAPVEVVLAPQDVIYYQVPNGSEQEIWWLAPDASPEILLSTAADIRIEYAYGEGDDLFLAYNHRIVRTDFPEANYQDGVDVLKSYNVSERFARTLQELSLWTNDNMFDNALRFIESDQGLIVLHDALDADLTHTQFFITDGNDIQRIGEVTFTGLFQNAVDRIVAFDSGYFFDGVQFNFNGGDQQQGVWSFDLDLRDIQLVQDFDTPKGDFDFTARGVRELTTAGDEVFFVTDDGTSGLEVWSYDGEVTSLLRDIRVEGSSNPERLTNVDGRLFFFANDGVHGKELWVSDGSADGTAMVEDAVDGSLNVVASASFGQQFVYFTQVGDTIQLWNSDGTADGTGRYVELTGTLHATDSIMDVGGRLFFQFDDGEHGREWWVTDGTAEGTALAVDVRPGAESSLPQDALIRGDELVFTADDGNGFDLWSIGIEQASLPGDANHDDVVDFIDFLIVSENFGREITGGVAVGDFNEDGDVSFEDFLLISENFGRTM